MKIKLYIYITLGIFIVFTAISTVSIFRVLPEGVHRPKEVQTLKSYITGKMYTRRLSGL